MLFSLYKIHSIELPQKYEIDEVESFKSTFFALFMIKIIPTKTVLINRIYHLW
jgi:hypothetical protein